MRYVLDLGTDDSASNVRVDSPNAQWRDSIPPWGEPIGSARVGPVPVPLSLVREVALSGGWTFYAALWRVTDEALVSDEAGNEAGVDLVFRGRIDGARVTPGQPNLVEGTIQRVPVEDDGVTVGEVPIGRYVADSPESQIRIRELWGYDPSVIAIARAVFDAASTSSEGAALPWVLGAPGDSSYPGSPALILDTTTSSQKRLALCRNEGVEPFEVLLFGPQKIAEEVQNRVTDTPDVPMEIDLSVQVKEVVPINGWDSPDGGTELLAHDFPAFTSTLDIGDPGYHEDGIYGVSWTDGGTQGGGAGDVAVALLRSSSLTWDVPAWSSLRSWLNRYTLAGFADDPSATPTGLLSGQLLPLTPVLVGIGPEGLKPFVSPYVLPQMATSMLPILEVSPGGLAIGGAIEFHRAEDRESRVTINYGYDAIAKVTRYSVTGRTNAPGGKSVDMDARWVWDHDTAFRMCRERLLNTGASYARRRYQVREGDEPELGGMFALRDSEWADLTGDEQVRAVCVDIEYSAGSPSSVVLQWQAGPSPRIVMDSQSAVPAKYGAGDIVHVVKSSGSDLGVYDTTTGLLGSTPTVTWASGRTIGDVTYSPTYGQAMAAADAGKVVLWDGTTEVTLETGQLVDWQAITYDAAGRRVWLGGLGEMMYVDVAAVQDLSTLLSTDWVEPLIDDQPASTWLGDKSVDAIAATDAGHLVAAVTFTGTIGGNTVLVSTDGGLQWVSELSTAFHEVHGAAGGAERAVFVGASGNLGTGVQEGRIVTASPNDGAALVNSPTAALTGISNSVAENEGDVVIGREHGTSGEVLLVSSDGGETFRVPTTVPATAADVICVVVAPQALDTSRRFLAYLSDGEVWSCTDIDEWSEYGTVAFGVTSAVTNWARA